MNNGEENSLPFFEEHQEKNKITGRHFQEYAMSCTNNNNSPHRLVIGSGGAVYNILSEPVAAQSKIKNKNNIQFLKTFRYYDSQNQLQLRAVFTLILSLVAVLLLLICLRQVNHKQKALVKSLEAELPFRIYSVDDFSKIPQDCKMVKILNLDVLPKNNGDNMLLINENDTRFPSVISLEISAAVHVSWFPILTTTMFPSIQILKLNADSLCLANTHTSANANTNFKSNADTDWKFDSSKILTNSIESKENEIIPQGMDAQNLHTLSIHQFTQESCKIISWILNHGHFPKLNRLELHHFHFTPDLFLNLLDFLRNPNNAMSVVQVTSSHFCTNCSLSQIQLISTEIHVINKTESYSPYVM